MNFEVLIKNIQFACERKGISVNKMLIGCGLSKNTLDNIKNGKVPGIDKILTIAKHLDVSVDYLLGYSPDTAYSKKEEKFITFANKHSDEQIDEIIEHYSRFLPKK